MLNETKGNRLGQGSLGATPRIPDVMERAGPVVVGSANPPRPHPLHPTEPLNFRDTQNGGEYQANP
jgi:hypothetical protein